MQIKNVTNRTLEIMVAAHSSQTLWTTEVQAGTTVSKDLPVTDAPYTVVGRWKGDPPLQYNFVPPTGVSNVKSNSATVTITDAFPSFFGTAG